MFTVLTCIHLTILNKFHEFRGLHQDSRLMKHGSVEACPMPPMHYGKIVKLLLSSLNLVLFNFPSLLSDLNPLADLAFVYIFMASKNKCVKTILLNCLVTYNLHVSNIIFPNWKIFDLFVKAR